MNLSIFGGTGFIGRNFLSRYFDSDNLYLIERYSRRPKDLTDTLWFISTNNNHNILDNKSTLDVDTNLKILCEGLESFKNNTPNQIFNFISSWFVYGNHPTPAHEVDECNPVGFYSITKHCAEQLLINYCQTFKLNYRILRLCNVLGPDDNVSPFKNALQYLINQMRLNQEITLVNGGYYHRNYMYIDDVIRAIHSCLETEKTLNTIVNIGHSQHAFFLDHMLIARKKLGYTTLFKNREDENAISFMMNTNKLQRLTGFEPKFDLRQMVEMVC